MKTIFVTSDVTYVKDNYLSLIDHVTSQKELPAGIEPAAVIMIKVPEKLLLKNILGLLAIGAPGFSFTLMHNLVQSRLNDPRIKLLSERGIRLFSCKTVNSQAALQFIGGLQPDLMVNMRTRNIYKKPVLDLPKIGCINIHHGLLPDNRGTMCDLWAWIEGRPVGFSIHWMNEKIDDGAIIERCEVDTQGVRSYIEIPFRSSQLEAPCLLNCLERIRRHGRDIGMANVTAKENYTRTPSPAKIAEIRRRGLRL
ncbi:MAG TPA: formyltransferase family protein [Candidatus Ozemobacteraceae bacterium]|nr:formyltransferase family protein [Candidatus Ozemobacteraceae bacterium]HNW12032.1 formyltransferase family protein [Candidatus Rifleibacterium sp.]